MVPPAALVAHLVAQVHGERETAPGCQRAGQRRERAGQLGLGEVHERIPGHDGRPAGRARRLEQPGEVADLERQVGVVGAGAGDHRRRQVDAGDVGARVGEERRQMPWAAADVDDRPRRVLRDPLEQPPVEGLGDELVPEVLGVGVGDRVVGGAHGQVAGLGAVGEHDVPVDRRPGGAGGGAGGGRRAAGCGGLRQRPEQVDPARVVLPGLALQLRDERVGPVGQPGQARLDVATVGEGVQPIGAGLQLPGRLRPAQQQDGQERALVGRESQCLREQLVVFHRARALARPHEAQQPLVLEVARDVLHLRVAVVGDRVAARALVARRAQRRQRQRIAGRHRDLLLQEGAQDALPGRVEHGAIHDRSLAGAARRTAKAAILAGRVAAFGRWVGAQAPASTKSRWVVPVTGLSVSEEFGPSSESWSAPRASIAARTPSP